MAIGLSSITTTWLLALGIAIGPRFIVADAALWLTVGAMAWWFSRGARRKRPRVPRSLRADWFVRGVFATTALIACMTVAAGYRAAPHGEWDAWAIWNHRARFLLLGGHEWTAAFSEAVSAHSDYPLLLPAAVARVWAYAGRDATIAPAVLAGAFGASIAVVILATLGTQRRTAWLAGTLLLASSVFVQQVVAQCADVPLAFFIVAALALACADSWLLAGTMSALAAWTKNEGVLFVAIMAIVAIATAARRRDRGVVVRWLAGGAPVLATILWFKVTLAPSVDLIERQTWAAMAAKALDLQRHAAAAKLMAQRLTAWGGPLTPGFFAITGLTAVTLSIVRRGPSLLLMCVVLLMLAGYHTAYVLSPFDLPWHVSTSADRLLTQLWPALVLAAFYRPRPSAPTADERQKPDCDGQERGPLIRGMNCTRRSVSIRADGRGVGLRGLRRLKT